MLIGKMICSEDPPPQLKVVNLQKKQIAIVCKLSCVHITWDTTPTYKLQGTGGTIGSLTFYPCSNRYGIARSYVNILWWGTGGCAKFDKRAFFTFLKITMLHRVKLYHAVWVPNLWKINHKAFALACIVMLFCKPYPHHVRSVQESLVRKE
jgi:hypothetical protein